MRRLVLIAAVFLFIAVVVNGQGRSAMPAVGGARMAAPVAAGHAAPVAGGVRVGSNLAMHIPSGTQLVVKNGQIHIRRSGTAAHPITPRGNHPRPITAQDQQELSSNSYPIPGLGFDVPHWAATQGQGVAGRRRNPRQFAAFFPFFDGGFVVVPQPIVEDEASGEVQQADYAPQTDTSSSRQKTRYREQAEVIPSVDNAGPQRESEQYVFVRRDGTIIFAVGYTWDKGNLRYVTNEGLRKSVALDSLDLDATRQFNEQRGLSFRLPA